ncbi:MAG: hypothetical protein J2P54_14410, partial [Bradyrhizobiaceae bacterium]|nr:hypothetical protein [Bradyrhizobiaceae bacterium]
RSCAPQSPVQRSVPVPYAVPSVPRGRVPWGRPLRTALLPSRPSGSAEVTHPFHPLRGKRFVVLKIRRVAGVETLVVQDADLGSFAVPREWTDWAAPEERACSRTLLIDAFRLVALAELIALLDRTGVDR